MATQIWKDYEVTLGSGDSESFTIRTSTIQAKHGRNLGRVMSRLSSMIYVQTI